MSLLLCGTDVYSQIIRHVICNYISAQENYSKLNEHIPPQYSSGKEYVEKKICATAMSGVLIWMFLCFSLLLDTMFMFTVSTKTGFDSQRI